ncbi:unnamed protein product [Brugia timori]|uniref:CUT domain-containing protein n=1 Tax=Brugia timori TaxID=42155 RepID=A0A0R3QT79_9BILA|nr:unnamed protein product [Brugia timori]
MKFLLFRSQGTLSDLLRNPKPWSKLKSGRETFRRMAKWLQEPEFQRMSALRLAGIFCCCCLFNFLAFFLIFNNLKLLVIHFFSHKTKQNKKEDLSIIWSLIDV